jgi:hypothetical protein
MNHEVSRWLHDCMHSDGMQTQSPMVSPVVYEHHRSQRSLHTCGSYLAVMMLVATSAELAWERIGAGTSN